MRCFDILLQIENTKEKMKETGTMQTKNECVLQTRKRTYKKTNEKWRETRAERQNRKMKRKSILLSTKRIQLNCNGTRAGDDKEMDIKKNGETTGIGCMKENTSMNTCNP